MAKTKKSVGKTRLPHECAHPTNAKPHQCECGLSYIRHDGAWRNVAAFRMQHDLDKWEDDPEIDESNPYPKITAYGPLESIINVFEPVDMDAWVADYMLPHGTIHRQIWSYMELTPPEREWLTWRCRQARETSLTAISKLVSRQRS